ncbi:MAG: hypothetical protein QOE00_1739 [Ilumatobacteraceae bacterium]
MTLTEVASLPMTPKELDADWLSDALGTEIEDVRVDDIIWGTATKVFLQIDHARDERDLPRAVCVKGGFDDRLRELGAANDAYRVEARFFGEIGPRLSGVQSLPRAFFAGVVPDATQGIVVMEDLRAAGARFVNHVSRSRPTKSRRGWKSKPHGTPPPGGRRRGSPRG